MLSHYPGYVLEGLDRDGDSVYYEALGRMDAAGMLVGGFKRRQSLPCP